MKIPYYKARDKYGDEWVKGFYFAFPETTYCFTSDYESRPVRIIHCICYHKMSDWLLPNKTLVCVIDIETLEQIGWFNCDRETYGAEPWFERIEEE